MKKQKVAVYVASMLVLGSQAVGYAEGDSHFVESGQVTGQNSVAIVNTSSVNGESAVAIGDASKVEANQAVAIGKDSKATVDGGVALGVDSIADRAGNRASNIGYNPMSNTHYKVGEAGSDNPKLEALYEAIRQANYKVLQAEEDVARANASRNVTEIATANAQKTKADQDLVDANNAYTAAIEEANKAGNEAVSSAWNATDGAVSVGGTKDGKQHTRQIINVAAGYEDTDAATVGQLRVVRNRLEREKPRYISIKSRDLGVDSNENNNGATQEGAIAIGPRAQSKSENAIAIGRNVQIGESSKNTVAIGTGIDTTGIHSVNIGEGTSTSGEYSTAVGQGATAGNSALAIGGSSKAESKNSVAVGRAATIKATALGATALGDSANSDESQSISVGYNAHAYQFASIAVGAQTETHGNGSIAIGQNSKVGESDKQAYAGVSIGMDSKTIVRTGVALGAGSYADRAVNSTSNKGYDPSLHGPHFADAAAETAVASSERSIWKATDSAVSVGDNRAGYRKTRQIINVAAGGEDTDAVNVAQLKALEKRNTILAGNDVPFKADGTVSDATTDTRVYTPGDKEIKIQGKPYTVYGVAPQAGAKAPDGKSEYAAPTLYSSDNLITYKDPTDSILRIGLLKAPTFTGINFDNSHMNISLGSNDNGKLTLTTGGKGDGATPTTSPVLTAASLKDVLKAEAGIKITEKDGGEYGKTYTLSLNKTELKGDPDFKGDKGDKGDTGSTGAKGEKGDTGAAGAKGDKGDAGTAGKDGVNGKSAYEYWKEIKGNENKTEDDFRKALEGGTKVNTQEYEKLEHQIGELGNDLQELRKESRNGDALGAALSALKPIQYDPLEPTQFMAGIGHYKNVNAFAIGIAHYTKESTMFHAGISMVRGATMINGGATFKFGNSPEKKAVPERYRNGPISSVLVLHDEMVAMKEAYGHEITVLTQENNSLRQGIEVLQQEIQELRSMVRK